VRMVAILLASPGITPSGLDVAILPGTYPDVLPSRRNRQRLDAAKDARIIQTMAAQPQIDKSASATLTTNARRPIGNIMKSGFARKSVCTGFKLELREGNRG